jgi:hypothetical protein
MKRITLLLGVLLLLLPMAIMADQHSVDKFSSLGPWKSAYGDWDAKGGMLVQTDTEAGMARIDRMAKQMGKVTIEFDVRYIAGGFEKGNAKRGPYHGGFGIHLGVGKPAGGKSWGNNNSYLLWLNVDDRPETKKHQMKDHYGFRAQIYDSRSDHEMVLAESILIPLPKVVIAKYLSRWIHIKLVIDTETGKVKAYDPSTLNWNKPIYYKFYLKPSMLQGNYVSLRTNSLGLAFDNFTIY